MSSEGKPSAAKLSGEGIKAGVCVSRFNQEITGRLLSGAIGALKDAGAEIDGPHEVAGAFELPLIARALARRCDVVVAVGCIIRGETPHFDLIANESARGLMDVMLSMETPVGNGIITTENREQAEARTADGSNKGAEAAEAAIEAYRTLHAIG